MKIKLGNNIINTRLGSNNVKFRNNIILPEPVGDNTAPIITTGPVIDQITNDSFRVTWSLDEGSQGQIEYGIDTNYGSFTTREFNYLTTHIQTVSNLNPNTEYHFRILGEDVAGNILTSIDYTVTTEALSALTANVTAPISLISENGTDGQFRISLNQTNTTGNPITINYTISGTATAGSDYTTLPGTASIPNNESFVNIPVETINDSNIEANETVVLTLNSGSGYTVGSTNSATITITDDDIATGGNANYFPSGPSVTAPSLVTTYTPTSSSDLSNPANANKIAIISNSFSATGVTLASGQIIRPAGGSISGTNINLNGAYIEEVADQAFSSSATFSSIYEDSWVYAEVFGAVGDGITNDSNAVDTLLNNVKFGKLGLNQTYVKNSPSFSNGSRQIILDMNGSTFLVTNDSGYNETTDQQAMFMFHEADVKFYNGTIDGNNLFSTAFRIGHPKGYHFEDLTIQNLENEPYATSEGIRVAAFIMHISNADGSKSWQGGLPWTGRSTTNVFENGYMNNCIIQDLNATGTGLPSISAQGIWWVIGDVNNTNTALVYHSNNIIRRITGGESEGIYWNGGVGITKDHALFLHLENETIQDCGDRAIKATSSNVKITNSQFERISPDVGPDQNGGLVSIFTLNNFSNPTNRVKNVEITNTTFTDPGNYGLLLDIGDVEDVTITGCSFIQNTSGNIGGLRLGTSQTNVAAEGGFDNALIQNNVFTNSHVRIDNQFLPTNFLFDTNTFNYTHTSGGNNGAAIFRHDQSTAIDGSGGFTVSNLTINVTISGVNFNGLFNSNGSFTNTTWDNIDLNYASSYSTTNGEFGRFYNSASFNSTNTISNCTMTNASGIDSLVIDGADKSVVITNSFGSNNSPIVVSGNTYTPTSVSDLTNSANAGKTAIITNSFDLTNTTIAANQVLTPNGGIISGTNINLNGSYVNNNFSQIFANTVTFNTLYTNSRLSPESFGATGDGVTNDNTAINTLINQCQLALGNPTSIYVKNNPTNYSRSGLFDWDMNGSSLEVTSSSNFSLTQVSVDAVFDFTNTSIKFTNGIFDLNNTYGRLFYLHGQPTIEFDNCTVRNLYSPNANNIRAVAFRHSIDSTSSGFISAKYTNNTIHNIVCQGDGNFNDGGGISKAWWYSMSGATSSTDYEVIHQNNVVYDIIGDDAEAFYAIQGGGTLSHNGTWLFDNENYYNCTRRAMKFCVSNVTLQNSFIEEMDDIYFNSAQQVGSMVDFFSTQSTNKIENLVVNNNTLKGRDGQDTHYYLLSFTDAQDITVTNNTIQMDTVENYGGLRLGSGTSFYSGYLANLTASGNDFINCGVQLLPQYAPSGQLLITNNTFTYNDFSENWGSNQATIRTTSTSGVRGNVDFTFNDIIINVPNSTSLFNGVIYSQGSEFTNMLIDNCTITYQNSTISRPFGYIQGNFGNTNTISNCTIVGDVGTESLVITGAVQNPVITNSFGDGSTPITVQ